MKIINLLIIIGLLCSGFLSARNNEFLFDTNLTYIPTPNWQECPSVTFDGTIYFVVWIDWRNALSYHSDMSDLSSYGNIYGCRVTPEGVPLDSAGIPISYYVLHIAGYGEHYLDIAYGDGIFLITWTDYRQGYEGDIYGARIDTNSVVLDPDGFIISESPYAQGSPAVAFDGSNFFVVWHVLFNIYGCRVSPEGIILDPDGILISNSGVNPSVSFDGSNYFVVLTVNDIYGIRVDTAGVVLDTNAIVICDAPDDQGRPSVTFGGSRYFVTWEDKRSATNTDIYGARVDTAGVVLDTNGFAISTLPEYEYSPASAFDATNYLVTWSDYATTYCARVDTNGNVLDSPAIVVSRDTSYEDHSASVAYDGLNYLIVWHTGQLSDDEVYGARVETSGIVIDTTSILLSMSGYPGYKSAASFDGTNYFAVWEDYRDTASTYIYGTRIDTLGTIFDPDGIFIIEGGDPSIAFDNTNYLVASSGVTGTRITATGSILDTFTIFADGGDQTSMLFDGTNYFVVWNYNWNIYGARVDTTGVVLDIDGIIISNGPYYEVAPSVSFDGTNYFVVWHYGTHESTFNIYGARVSTTGVLIDTSAISIATGSARQWYPSVAYDGTNYFVVWQDHRNGYEDIYGSRVTPDGVVLNPEGIPLCTASSAQYKPEIAYDGHNYCVIWEDWRNGDYTDIYGCYVTPSGVVTDEFIISDQPNLQLEATLIKGPDKFLVTYTGFADSINGRPANAMRIWGKFQEFVGVEESSNSFSNNSICLYQNYPNPFTHTTTIKYQIPVISSESQIRLKIYEVTGRLVRSFDPEGLRTEGQFDYKTMRLSDYVVWDGCDESGHYVGAGVYFYELITENFNEVKKMIFLR